MTNARTKPEPPGPKPLRQGPRPFGLHLGMGMAILLSSPAALPLLNANWPHWHPTVRMTAENLRRDLRQRLGASAGPPESPPDAPLATEAFAPFTLAVDREMRRRLDRFLTGLERYRHHPYQRDIEDAPPVWREGATRLLEMGGGGKPVLFVPSLVNRGYILDLSWRKSLLRWLAGQGGDSAGGGGIRPFLLEWGYPGVTERGYSLSDVVAGRLVRALEATCARVGGPVTLVGYCMGGLLALGAALRRPDLVSGYVAMATPWDFHADDAAGAQRTAALINPFDPVMRMLGELPVDGVQTLFATLDPLLAYKKFSRFATMDMASDDADDFVALEDWLNDGVSLPAPIARECLTGWYGDNTTGRGEWRVADVLVRPADLRCRSLVIVPARDRIVPPASAAALGSVLPGATVWQPSLGHIGMVVSGGAKAKVWAPLRDWLLSDTNGGASGGH
ncbi:alpha/beta fold hydrolase [Niveispirillum sp.]|uniref:alpha/beta fold hydrolase n=1 Tax=Niveispirillum sp. TaxID=1917217 RepID=UPI0025F7DAFA|nr:alpha/beta fold hydrolase [Niveispirillum sp.]